MPANSDRSLTWWPFAGAAVIAAAAVVAMIVVGSGKDTRLGLTTDSDGALSCPVTYVQRAVVAGKPTPRAWVPIIATGVDGGAGLVVDTKPQHVTVCRYPTAGAPTATESTLRLGNALSLTGGLQQLTDELAKAPRATSPASGPCSAAGDTYLLGLLFATGAEWVAIPGTGCQRVTNGTWDTDQTGLAARASAALASGTWT